jgi:glycosyltransferase 2 family protein
MTRIILKYMFLLSVSIGFLYYVLTYVSFSEILYQFYTLKLSIVLLATGIVFLGTIILQSAHVFHALKVERKLPFSELCRINLALMFYSFWLPTILVAGIRWKFYNAYLSQPLLALRLVGFQKVIQIIIALIAFSASAYVLFYNLPDILKNTLGSIALLGVLVTFYFIFFFMQSFEKLEKEAAKLIDSGSHVGKLIFRRIYKVITFISFFRDLTLRKKLLIFVFATLQFCCIILSAYVVLYGFYPNVPFWPVVLCRSLLIFLLLIPITLSGVGLREVIYFSILPVYGVDTDVAVSASLCMLGIQFLMAILGGGVVLMTSKVR